jgi:hypothetical protein
MGSFKTGPLSSLLLIGLLALISAVLIAPDVDLPDTAFQRNTSPLAIHALSSHVPQRNANASASHISLRFADAADLALRVFSCDSAVEVSSVPHRILRC